MKNALRIIQVVNVRWFNATAWYGLSLARLLQESGHEVRVLGLPGAESFARAEDMGLDVLPLPLNTTNPLRQSSLLRRMRALLREFKPHVVNCHRGEGLLLWGLCKFMEHPFALIRTRGDQRPPKANPANRALHARLVDALIATNSRTARQCRDLLGVLPDAGPDAGQDAGQDKLFMIPGGVDTARFAPDPAGRTAVRRKYGFADGDMVIGLLGRFDAVKGQKELIDAVRRVREGGDCSERWKRIKLMLMGFPTSLSQEAVQGWIQEAGLSSSAVITGKVDDVAAHISAMDMGIIASQGSEAIARAAFEIMACGVPLAGTDVGVMPDLLSAEALVPVGNTTALAALLERGLCDAAFLPALREQQGLRMQTLSNACFLEQTLDVYRFALGRCTLRKQL
ncbi:MAG: glycosyltransferase [Desulfovibrionaceae bacterium]|nr:glycosyltransferase [Desulfovibrionaceae bacterium]